MKTESSPITTEEEERMVDFRSKIIQYLALKDLSKNNDYEIAMLQDEQFTIKIIFLKKKRITPEEFNKDFQTSCGIGHDQVLLNFKKLLRPDSSTPPPVSEAKEVKKDPLLHPPFKTSRQNR